MRPLLPALNITEISSGQMHNVAFGTPRGGVSFPPPRLQSPAGEGFPATRHSPPTARRQSLAKRKGQDYVVLSSTSARNSKVGAGNKQGMLKLQALSSCEDPSRSPTPSSSVGATTARGGSPIRRQIYKRMADGREYRGQMKSGCMHGAGECTWPDGRTYSGQWQNNMMHGMGCLTTSDGEVWSGRFRAGTLHGGGERRYANGDIYRGEFRDGEREGEGTFWEKATGLRYEGHWVHGSLYGEGSVSRPDGSKYVGEWVDGIPDGMGREIWPDGSYYEGPLKNNSAEGYGLRTFSDGCWFEGTFQKGFFQGHGTYHWPDGSEFEGLWHDNRLAGPGCQRLQNGTTIVGHFGDEGAFGEGTKHWPCGCVYTGFLNKSHIDQCGTLKWRDGRCYVGAFKDDTMEGQGTLVWADEGGVCSYQGSFVANLFEGEGKMNWSSGASYEGEFSGGHYHGKGTFCWPNNRAVYIGSWVKGEMWGHGSLRVFDETDGKSYEYIGQFEAGHMEGKGTVTFTTNAGVDRYEGDFKASRFSGEGSFCWGTGHQLDGLFEDGYCNRVGRKIYPDGRLYTGELKYDLEHGKGLLKEAGGREFVALWERGEVQKELVMSAPPEFDLVSATIPELEEPGSGHLFTSNTLEVGGGASMFDGTGTPKNGSFHTQISSPGTADVGGVTSAPNMSSQMEAELSVASVQKPSRKLLLPVIDETGLPASGKNLVVFLNGDRYIGLMKDGRKHGRGIYIYADLVHYSGVWDMDVLRGIRHPVTCDLLPVEVRRLGPAPPETSTEDTEDSEPFSSEEQQEQEQEDSVSPLGKFAGAIAGSGGRSRLGENALPPLPLKNLRGRTASFSASPSAASALAAAAAGGRRESSPHILGLRQTAPASSASMESTRSLPAQRHGLTLTLGQLTRQDSDEVYSPVHHSRHPKKSLGSAGLALASAVRGLEGEAGGSLPTHIEAKRFSAVSSRPNTAGGHPGEFLSEGGEGGQGGGDRTRRTSPFGFASEEEEPKMLKRSSSGIGLAVAAVQALLKGPFGGGS